MQKKRLPTQYGHYEFFEEIDHIRKLYARLINISDYQRVAIIPSVSYGMAIVAKNLRISKGENIVVVGEQFPSNVYPWRKKVSEADAELRTIAVPSGLENRGLRWNQYLLEAIDNQTCMVAIPHTHWSDGTLFNLHEIRQRTHEVNALLVVDGTQSVGALSFNAAEIQPDALICAGYKWLMGPYGITLGFFNDYFDEGEPLEEGWIARYKSEDFTNLVNYQDHYQPKALRYDMGQRSNFITIPMMGRALEEVLDWRPDYVQSHCQEITNSSVARLRELGCWVENETQRGRHLFGIRLPSGASMETLQKGLKNAKISVSVRGDSIRVSPHVYNQEQDIDRLVDSIQQVL
ncbi:MAG: aminotransferase class V-fold PLP-dependent enzyme [Cyclobacteriaceae bacterium]